MSIEWSKIAKPQKDGYDSDVYTSFDRQNFDWIKRVPEQGTITLAEGTIAVAPPRFNMSMGETSRCVVGEVDQKWADAQTSYLNAWPAGYHALKLYLDEFWPWHTGMQGFGKGCSSGHAYIGDFKLVADQVHAVYVTIDDFQGCAQGIYHEFAHLRLRTLGIHMETHSGLLLTNKDTELYNSSVRFDVKRPMSAVLQGLYAWLMFIENDWHLYQAKKCSTADFFDYTIHNLPKIENGLREVLNYATVTPAGEEFLAGLEDWAKDLLDRCHTIAKAELPLAEYQRRCSTARI